MPPRPRSKKSPKRQYKAFPTPTGPTFNAHADGRLTLILPIPNPILAPNARAHWAKKSAKTKIHRERARLTTLVGLQGKTSAFSGYRLAFYWPDLRGRDDDNAAASCKAYRDGIADALRIDDNKLPMCAAPAMHLDRENPRLEITLIP